MRHASLAAAALLLSACTGTPITYGLSVTPAFNLREVSTAAANPIPTAVWGNPFAESDEAFRAGMIAAMQGRNYSEPLRFVPLPEGGAPPTAYRMVMSWGDLATGAALCRNPASPGVEARSRVLHGAFCRGPTLMVELFTRLPAAVQGSADPVFRSVVAGFMVELLAAPNLSGRIDEEM